MTASVAGVPATALGAEIRCGETLARLLAGGPDEIGFAAREGEVVSATVVPTLPLPGFVPRWRIADVEGIPVELSDGERRCTGRCQTAPLPRGGAFTLRVADSGLGVGLYIVTLEAVSATANGASNGPPAPACARLVNGEPDGTRPVTSGAALAGVIDRPGETDTFTLEVGAGERVEVALGRTGVDDDFRPAWEAFDATGASIVRVGENATGPVAIGGVVTILVADAALRVTGHYEVAVGHRPPPTTTTLDASTTTSSTIDGTTSTTGSEPTTSTTGVSSSSTTTSTTTIGEGSSTSTTTTGEGSSTSTTAAVTTTSTTTVTGPGATTTLLPLFDLGSVVAGPALGEQGMLGRALASVGGRLLIGAPHETIGRGRDRVRDAGGVLVVDVTGTVGGPSFGRVLARVARADAPAPGDALGVALTPAGSGVMVGAPGIRAAFVFPNVQEPDVSVQLPPPGVADDGFGLAIAAPDDLVVVGAPHANDDAGAAYVYARTGASRCALQVPNPVVGARLGAALAASGSLVLVGAPGGTTGPGKAFVFDAAACTLVRTLEPDPSDPGDEFGAAVAFDGEDLLIGAPGTDEQRGRIYRFGSTIRTYDIPNLPPNARFGAALAVGDGRLVVGAPGNDGAAFVFDVEGGALVESLEKPMPRAGDGFGSAVAVAAGRVFVAAPGDDAGTVDGGATYVFEDGVMVATLRERLSPDAFGASAAAGANALYAGAPDGAGGSGYVARIDPGLSEPTQTHLTADGRPTRFGASVAALDGLIVVGAPETAVGGSERVGAVHLFDGAGQRGTIQNPAPGMGDEFGFAVGTVDGDVVASAPFAGESDTGMVYRIDLTGRLRVTYGKPTPSTGDFFGAALSGHQGQVLVGAPLDASGGPAAGAVYLFDAETASISHAIPNPQATQDLFGAAVALGQWLVVGAPLAAGGTGVVGTVWVFDRATGTLVRRLENPRSGAQDHFGAAVALLDDRLLVGAPLADDRMADSGLVHLFEPATGQLLQTFRNPPQGAFDNFGFSVAAGAAGILIGSPGPSRVYVYDPIGATAAPLRTAAALPLATDSQCGNGLVEGSEQCDDANDVDTDDCRSDCTAGPCCTLDVVADPITRCDDGNPCTIDELDPALGCRHRPSNAPGCCESDDDCGTGQCRLCVGCFVYKWDCCETGSVCIPSNPACASKTCVEAALCQCEGKLDCGDEVVPDQLRTLFATACDSLRLQVSVAPDGTITKPELVVARQRTRAARVGLRKTVRTARALLRKHQLSRQCRKNVAAQVRVVKKAIPRGKRLRRCVIGN